jgi:hypothetical protein
MIILVGWFFDNSAFYFAGEYSNINFSIKSASNA